LRSEQVVELIELERDSAESVTIKDAKTNTLADSHDVVHQVLLHRIADREPFNLVASIMIFTFTPIT